MNNCCSLSLSTAGIVVGLFYATISLLTTILGIEYLIEFAVEGKFQHSSWLIEATSLILVLSLIGFISSILLVFGTFKRRHLLLLPWLGYGIVIVLFICQILLYCIFILIDIICTKRRFDYSVLIEVLIALVILAFQIHLWKRIHSLYKKIRSESEQQTQRDLILENSIPLYRKSVEFPITTEI